MVKQMKSMKKICAVFLPFFLITACTHYLTKQQQQALVEIIEILSRTISETEAVMNRKPDPTSPYRDMVKRLREIQKQINRIKSGEVPYDEKRMKKYNNEIIEIQMNVNNPVDLVLGVDVFFGPGKYKISDFSAEGKKTLDKFASDIIALQAEKLRELFPEHHLVIFIKAIGYADEMPLSQWFADKLEKDTAGPLPEDPVEKRKALNRELSFRRAKSIAEYVKLQLKNTLRMDNVSIDEPIIIGLGEISPYDTETVSPPYMSQDKRRRICKIHGNVFVTSD
jgi:outer membrane protein OmpA-like peptidoglycan-associated protein